MNVDDTLAAYREGRLSTEAVLDALRERKLAEHRMPLSQGQRGLWWLQRIEPGSTAYHIPVCLRLTGVWDAALLERAVALTLKRHTALAHVVREEEGVPWQAPAPNARVPFEQHDASGWSQGDLNARLQALIEAPMPLATGPLFRAHLLRRSASEVLLLLVVHHIVCDGRSVHALVTTLMNAYEHVLQAKEGALSPEAASYADFVAWESAMLAGDEGLRHREYWLKHLAGPLPALRLPSDRPRDTTGRVIRGRTYSRQMPASWAERIKPYCAAQRSTPAAFFLAAYQALLHALSGSTDIVVGVPTVGRPEPRFLDVVGYFINMIAVRGRLSPQAPFSAMLKDAQFALIDGIDHAAYPFPSVVRDLKVQRTPGESPVFQVAYEYQSASVMRVDSVALGADKSRVLHIEQGVHQEGEYELVLEVYERQNGYLFNFKHDRDLYDEDTIAGWCDRYVDLIDAVIAQVEQPLSQLAARLPASMAVPAAWNATEADYPRDTCVHELIDRQARQQPGRVAVRHGANALDYAELKRRSDLLAAALQARGVKTGDLVGLCVGRGVDLVVAVLGITKAGAAYVPLDPAYPADRLAYMLDDAAASLVVSQAALVDKVAAMSAQRPGQVHTLCLDRDWPDIEAAGARGVQPVRGAEHLAYVMYTSGSTGKPKGVMIPHRALTNFMVSMAQLLNVTDADRLLAVTTYSFDISGLEIYLPLMRGGTCVVCDEATPRDAGRLMALLADVRPTFMQATPSTWNLLFQAGWRNPERLTALCGGEALPAALHRHFTDSGTNAWNLFGPTETTIWSTAQRVVAGEPITIGRPIANTQIHILDEQLRELPVGAPGELCIGGDGLAAGYRNRPELTAEKFIDHPLRPGQKLYRTGDLARWRRDGTIDYLGRIDTQVKIRGFRIELGEIEAVLGEHACIGQCAVVVEEQGASKRLVAFVARRPGVAQMAPASELRDHLRRRLPDHMIPARVVEVDALPLTPNGKVDRKTLAERALQTTNAPAATAPAQAPAPAAAARPANARPATLAKVREVWRAVLGNDDFGNDEGFFSVGGDSFLAVSLAARLSKAFATTVEVTALFQYPTVRKLAAMLEPPAADAPSAPVTASPSSTPVLLPVRDTSEWEGCVAIVGISCQFSGAADHRAFWRNLREGRDVQRFFDADELRAAGVPERLATHPDYVPMGLGFDGRDEFDAEFFRVTGRDAELMDPQLRHLLMHSWKAIEDAGYAPSDIPDTSVYMSASNNFYPVLSLQPGTAGLEGDSYLHWLLAQTGTLATFISHKLDLRGGSVFQHTNCSSSLVGLHTACRALLHGDSRHALVGAATIQIEEPHGYLYQDGMNFSRSGRIRAFDAGADGMVVGEGVAVLLLKRAADAIADRDSIYAIVRGTAINNDGADKTSFYAPSIQGQVGVMRKALDAARVDPLSVSYVEAHGTGTRLGDPVEFAALREAYRGDVAGAACGLGSVKTQIGHTDTVAGLAGCIKVALAMRHGELPASLNYEAPNPAIRFDGTRFHVVQQLERWAEAQRPWRAAVTSLGIGGTNAHAVLEQAPLVADEPGEAAGCVVPVSALTRDRLVASLMQLADFLESQQRVSLPDLAYTLQVGREAMRHRAAIVADDRAGLLAAIHGLIAGESQAQAWMGEAGQARLADLLDSDDVATLAARWCSQGRLDAVAQAWVGGLSMPWAQLHAAPRRRLNLPTYPFSKTRYWPARRPLPSSSTAQVPATKPAAEDADSLLTFEECWSAQPLPTEAATVLKRVVYFVTDAAQQKAITAQVATSDPGVELVFVAQHRRFEAPSERGYRMPRKDAQAYIKLLTALKQRHGSVDAMVWLWPVEDEACMEDYAGLLYLLQAFYRTELPCRRLLIGARLGSSVSRCHAEAWVGFERSLRFAITYMPITCAYWEGELDGDTGVASLIGDVMGELHAPAARTVLYRDGVRHVTQLRPTQPRPLPTLIERGKTYLITGGFGGIGLALARHLTAERGANVVLTGRSAYDDTKRDTIDEIEEQGAGAVYVQADVSDVAQMQEVLRRAKARFGHVHGVLHAAGLEDNVSVFEKGYEAFAAVLEPKVRGTMVIDEVFGDEPLDFVSYFSTASAVLGDIGNCNYAIANRFQMAYAEHRNRLQREGRAQGKAVVINWPFWKDGGMGQVDPDGVNMFLKLGGQRAITNEEGIALFETLTAQPNTQHLVLAGKPARIHAFMTSWGLGERAAAATRSPVVTTAPTPVAPEIRAASTPPVVAAAGPAGPASAPPALAAWLRRELEEALRAFLKLGDTPIDVTRHLVDYGFDSIGLAGFARELGQRLGVMLSPMQFFNHPSIERYAEHLVATQAGPLQARWEKTQSAAVA